MSEIPHVIHYCWFGYGEKSPLMCKCIESWKNFFPEYEIIEWNESNFDIYQNMYCREAYEHKKWAFVSDYARLYIIYNFGGIYLDTDVEIIKSYQNLINSKGYLCFENTTNEKNSKCVATGLGFAAKAGNVLVKQMLDDYQDIHFEVGGVLDLKPCPLRNTESLIKMGLQPNGKMQELQDIIIYPYEYFCGYDIANSHPKITNNTYTIHHYAGTWKEKESIWTRLKYKVLIRGLQKVIGVSNYDALKRKLKG